ncbi:hypothetical protein Pelo_6103 [Pelomyxa schiedti]|nr:hypothetical protein Pelo_6103 [Pelomyxa schiedti]
MTEEHQRPMNPITSTTTPKYSFKQRQSVAFLAGWHERAGAHSVMMMMSSSPTCTLAVPLSVARIILEFLLGDISVYWRGTWQIIGKGITVTDDTPQWTYSLKGGCGSTVGGRIAWLEPSLQEISRTNKKVYWAFDVAKFRGGCQVGLGASTSLIGIELDSETSGGGDYYPINCSTLCYRGVKSFGLAFFSARVETRLHGVISKGVTDAAPVRETDQFSFLLTFEAANKQWGHVDVFRNMKLLVSFDHVDTSQPLYPAVNMCCQDCSFKFVMEPTLPRGL